MANQIDCDGRGKRGKERIDDKSENFMTQEPIEKYKRKKHTRKQGF